MQDLHELLMYTSSYSHSNNTIKILFVSAIHFLLNFYKSVGIAHLAQCLREAQPITQSVGVGWRLTQYARSEVVWVCSDQGKKHQSKEECVCEI